MVTRNAGFSKPQLTNRQRRELGAAGTFLGEGADVRAYAAGRANARWSAGAQWLVGGFAALFVIMFVVFHVVLFPGAIVVIALIETVRPRRGIAVTPAGITELGLSHLNGRPSKVLATVSHAALFGARPQPEHGRPSVWFGSEVVTLRDADLARLQAAASVATPMPAPPGSDGLPPPPPSFLPVVAPSGSGDTLPRWREPSALWVLIHLFVGLAAFIGVIMAALVVPTVLGRDTTNPPPAAGLLWVSLGGAIAGWMCFAFVRRPLRDRLLLLGALIGGALVLAVVAVTLGTPTLPR